MPRKERYRPHKIDAYFANNPVPSVAGLALAIGMTRRDLITYNGPARCIRKAMQRIEAFLETRAYGPQSNGFVFGLKNNFGWHDSNALKTGPEPGREKTPQEMSDAELVEGLMSTVAWREWKKVKDEPGAGSFADKVRELRNMDEDERELYLRYGFKMDGETGE